VGATGKEKKRRESKGGKMGGEGKNEFKNSLIHP